MSGNRRSSLVGRRGSLVGRRGSIQGRRGSMRGIGLGLDPETAGLMDDDGDDNMQPIEVKRVPEDQCKLTDEQLSETYTKVITAADPNVSQSRTRFDYDPTALVFKPVPSVDHLAVHFSMDGVLIAKDSEEARKQQAHNTEDGAPGDGEEAFLGDGKINDRALKNQFNFSERASQTFNNPMRNREASTEPPPTEEFSDQATQWAIFDAYLEDLERQQLAKQLKENKKSGGWGDKNDGGDEDDLPTTNTNMDDDAKEADILNTKAFSNSLKIMERMVNQNAEAEVFKDYKYYEDTTEHKREDGRGTFLPLWRFTYDRAKRKTVTAICWNPEYTDLFAVGYGSYDFMKQGSGLIACYTLKNTSHPEYVFPTSSGVMCLDFHPQHSALLAAGLYDGTVAVFDVRSENDQPIYVSSDPKVKHTDPVWQVYWQKAELGKAISFYSISSDGRVTAWNMNKNELVNEEVIELKLAQSYEAKAKKPDDALEEEDDNDSKDPLGAVVGLAGGCCFDFNKSQGTLQHLFVVGTEEGSIHSYSKAYNSQYIRTFEGHNMAVYTVKWNYFHPGVFLSCSADWTVKLWEHNTESPIMSFDLNTSCGDVAWAPYSSTVFACITTDGKLRLYDLNVNKHEPIGETRVNKKAKLTHIAFNPKQPIICVGDDRGVVNVLKLSSNLRKMTAPLIEDIELSEEIQKLDRLLIMPDDSARDPMEYLKDIIPEGQVMVTGGAHPGAPPLETKENKG